MREEEEVERGLGRRHETGGREGTSRRDGQINDITYERSKRCYHMERLGGGLGERGGKVSGPGGGIIAKENPSSVPSHL